jgi:hydroxymethylglutaryl-CoA reductase
MLQRKGGVKEIRLRNIDSLEIGCKDYSLDILIDVKEAMGANLINTVAERAKEILSGMGIRTGISILSNYCVERMATSTFTIPVDQMNWKGYSGF